MVQDNDVIKRNDIYIAGYNTVSSFDGMYHSYSSVYLSSDLQHCCHCSLH